MSKNILKNKYLSLSEVSGLLGVSSATVRNWIKHGYLIPQNKLDKKLLFDCDQVKIFKKKVVSGQVKRLNKRANKKHSTNTFIPDEYADDQNVVAFVQEIVDKYKLYSLNIEKVLFMLILNLLEHSGLIVYKKPFNFMNFIFDSKDTIRKEINWWQNKIYNKNLEHYYIDLLNIKLPKANDILGLVYQSLVIEGDKTQGGSYYTPKILVDEIIKDYVKKDYLVLDPCCGTGQFILSAAEKTQNPSNVWGFDIDEIAVRLARLNLLLKFPNNIFSPNIYKKNTLFDLWLNKDHIDNSIPIFDVIATNPPWGAHFAKTDISKLLEIYPSITSRESFSYFIEIGLRLLKNNGILSFILPESILNIKTHKDIRKILLEQTSIMKIKHLDRIFKNVFTPVIRMDIKKTTSNRNNQIKTEKDNTKYQIEQVRLETNTDYLFNVFTDNTDVILFDKIYSLKHYTLKNNADWALGIVTGDNKKYLLAKKTKTNEPIITGKNIKKFIVNDLNYFIEFNSKNFQQVALETKYRVNEKLIYKFIAKELVFSYDDKKMLTLNSANILIPKIKDYPIKTILALFNSSIYQFLYQKKFGSLKILKSDLEQLPIPIFTKEQHTKIKYFVNILLNKDLLEKERKKTFENLDNYIMKLFSIKENEKEYINKSIKVSKNN